VRAAGVPNEADVVDVALGERYDVLITANGPRQVFHCHFGHHLTNDGVGPGGS
jgi:manganese oxidase